VGWPRGSQVGVCLGDPSGKTNPLHSGQHPRREPMWWHPLWVEGWLCWLRVKWWVERKWKRAIVEVTGTAKQKIESISSRGVGCIAIEMTSVEQRSRLGMLVGEKDVDVLAVAGTGRADGVAGAEAVAGSEKQKDGYEMELKCVKCDVLTATLEHVMQSEEDVQAKGLRKEAAVQRKNKNPVVEYSHKNGSGKLLSSERPFCGTAWQFFHFMMCSCPL